MSLSTQYSSIYKGNRVGSLILFSKPIPGAVSRSNSSLAGKAEISEASTYVIISSSVEISGALILNLQAE
jgi:hypothetical protein